MEDFKKELKSLLEKYDASIDIITDGEGYSQTVKLEIEIRKGRDKEYLEFREYESIDKYSL